MKKQSKIGEMNENISNVDSPIRKRIKLIGGCLIAMALLIITIIAEPELKDTFNLCDRHECIVIIVISTCTTKLVNSGKICECYQYNDIPLIEGSSKVTCYTIKNVDDMCPILSDDPCYQPNIYIAIYYMLTIVIHAFIICYLLKYVIFDYFSV